MPQTKKYLDFVASAPYERGSKHGGPDARRSYVTIACPHCDAAFVEIAADRLHTNKASECLKHLRVCDAAIGAGVLAPPAKRRDPRAATPQGQECVESVASAPYARDSERGGAFFDKFEDWLREQKLSKENFHNVTSAVRNLCLLYTSDAADE